MTKTRHRMQYTLASPGWPPSVSLLTTNTINPSEAFFAAWRRTVTECCNDHPIWHRPFIQALTDELTSEEEKFALASVWVVNMVIGSYCFPRYIAALASRTEHDAIRHGLLENAWDESGSHGHISRSHFWLAVR